MTDRTCYEANIFDQRPDPSFGTGAIVHLAIAAPTNVSSTATGFIPRPGRLPSKVFFPAADSHRTRSTLNVSAGAYTASQERWYSSICA